MLSDVISWPMWRKRWRHTWSCQNKYMGYVSSVSKNQIRFEQVFTLEKESKLSVVSMWLSKHSPWCRAVTKRNTRTKKAVQLRVATCFLWCQQWPGTVNNGTHSLFCGWCTCVVSPCKMHGDIRGVKRPQHLLEDLIETVDSKNGLTILLCLESVFIQWFSSESYP